MKKLFLITLLFYSFWASAQHQVPTDSSENMAISKALDALSEAAACWTPEQKQEFADVFFMERGKFTIPKEPIVLKTFKNH
ncbi:MAG: hypothetical protein EB023_07855 [Flavobacteriia bacterium]|nr:hypothetical protein [Flavobacteriia bacterium]